MRLLLALVFAVFGFAFFVLGVPALIYGEDDLTWWSIGGMTRTGSIATSELVEVEGGVLVLGSDIAVHLRERYAYVPLVSTDAAAAIAGRPGIDLEAARAADETQRIVLVKMRRAEFGRAVEENGSRPTDRVVGPLDVKGRLLSRSDWGDEIESVVGALDLDPVAVAVVYHDDRPRNRWFGGVAVVFGVLCAFGVRAMIRSRRRRREARAAADARIAAARAAAEKSRSGPSQPPPTPSEQVALRAASARARRSFSFPEISGAAVAKVGVVLVFIGMAIAKFADTAVRSADDLIPVAAKNADVPGPGIAVRAAKSADEFDAAELIVKGIDTGKKISDAHRTWTKVFGADTTIQAVAVLDQLVERYERGRGIGYDLVGTRQIVIGQVGIDGVLRPATNDVLEELPDVAKGEWTRVLVHPPTTLTTGVLTLESRSVSESKRIVKSKIRVAVEIVEGTWAGFERGEPIRLRYTVAGMATVRAETERLLQLSMNERFPVSSLKKTYKRVETDAKVTRDSNVSIVVTKDRMTIKGDGPTVIELSLGAWR